MTHTTDTTVVPPRLPRAGSLPTISVVIVSSAASDDLSACLDALAPRCARVAAQVIVVRACADPEMAQLRAAMPEVRFLCAPPTSTERELRRLGMMEAAGDIVVLTTDHHAVDDAWAAVLLRAANDSNDSNDSNDAARTARPA